MGNAPSGSDDGGPPSGVESAGVERDSGKPKEEIDDFHRWLEGLGT